MSIENLTKSDNRSEGSAAKPIFLFTSIVVKREKLAVSVKRCSLLNLYQRQKGKK